MTSTALTHNPPTLPEKMQYAKALAESRLLPEAYVKQPANVLLAMELGAALQIPAIQAIQSVNVIKGRPTMSADLMAAVIRRAGHKLRVTETADPLSVTAELIRHDDPDFTFRAVWDVAKAKAASLWGTNQWAKYPGQMMRARAISEVARQGASDALMGVAYVPEELGAAVDVDGAPVDVVPVVAGVVEPDRWETAEPATVAATVPVEDIQDAELEPDEPETAPETPGHTKARGRMFALFTERNIEDANQQRAGMSKVLGREIESRADLTVDDMRAVIASLEAGA